MTDAPILPDDEPPSMPTMPTQWGGDPACLGRIDHYDLLRKLGGGGFGVVYLARDTVSGVEVALKTLHPLLKHNAEEMDLLREKFRLVHGLTHPNIAKALVIHLVREINIRDEAARAELKLSPGDSVMVMDYAPGVTLSRWWRQFPGGVVPFDLALEVGRQVAAALDYAHSERIVHRDVKPSNVMVETVAAEPRPLDHGQNAARPSSAPTLRVRILDFGLAAEIRSSMSRVSTESGDTSGTRPYMAPEQWLGRKQDGRTDQYALACVLYELLSGAPPFAGVFETGDPAVMKSAVVGDTPEEIEGLSAVANAALLRALAKSPEDRFPSCTALVEAFSSTAERLEDTEGGAIRPGEPQGQAALEADVLRRKVALARALEGISAEDRAHALFGPPAKEAETELVATEEAFKWNRFAAAAACLDRAEAALARLQQVRREEAERPRREKEEVERRAREKAERKRKEREERERLAREKAERERKAREEAERLAREKAERELDQDGKPKKKGKEILIAVCVVVGTLVLGIGGIVWKSLHDKKVLRAAIASCVAKMDEVAAKLPGVVSDEEHPSELEAEAAQLSERMDKLVDDVNARLPEVDDIYGKATGGRYAWPDTTPPPRVEEPSLLEEPKPKKRTSPVDLLSKKLTELQGYPIPTDLIMQQAKQNDMTADEFARAKLAELGVDLEDEKVGHELDAVIEESVVSPIRELQIQARDCYWLCDEVATGVSFAPVPPESPLESYEAALAERQKVYAERQQRLQEAKDCYAQANRKAQEMIAGIAAVKKQAKKFVNQREREKREAEEVEAQRQRETAEKAEKERLAAVSERRRTESAPQPLSATRDTPEVLAMPGDARAAGDRWVASVFGVSVPLRWCPPGSFMMGSRSSASDHESNETQHCVTFTKGFYMGETEVTQRLWKKVMGDNPSHFKSGDEYPVEQVSWYDCQEFVKKLNAQARVEGFWWRLPLEAEWEYACRAGTETTYCWGRELHGDKANCDGNHPFPSYGTKGPFKQKTTPVKSFAANAWGIFDMHGNVWEWCEDWYGTYPVGTVTYQCGPSSGSFRVSRGGGWNSDASFCRSAYRGRVAPGDRSSNLGLRIALVPVQ